MLGEAKGIFLLRNGLQTGPFAESEIRRYWGYGSVTSEDLIWLQGMADYITVGEYFAFHNQRLASKMPAKLVIHGNSPGWQAEEELPVGPSWQMPPWFFQLVCWILLLLATAIWLSFPTAGWVAAGVYALSLILAISRLFIQRSAGGWIALTAHVAVAVFLWFYVMPGHGAEKSDVRTPVSSSHWNDSANGGSKS